MSLDSPFRNDPQRAQKERQAAIAAEVLREDMRWFMDSPRGRRLMWGWLSEAGIHRSTFDGEQPMKMAFLEGKRNFGIILETMVLQHAPEQWEPMSRESRSAPAGE
jgi:hypothetical protein